MSGNNLELPALIEAAPEIFEPRLDYEQYIASCDRFEWQQRWPVDHRLRGNLWSKVQKWPTDFAEKKGEELPVTLRLPRTAFPDANQSYGAERWHGTAIHAVGLYTILETVHTALERRVNLGRGRVGLLLPKYMDRIGPSMAPLGVVVATYAMNDHIVRGRSSAE